MSVTADPEILERKASLPATFIWVLAIIFGVVFGVIAGAVAYSLVAGELADASS